MRQNELEELLKPLINELGYVLWGCEYLAQGRDALLRVYIDKEEGISITDCERVSRHVSAVLDVEDPITGKYQLEISSPGIPRPLFSLDHYQQYKGCNIKIKLFKPINNQRNITGSINAVRDEVILIQVEGEELEVQFSQIVKANLIGE